MPSKRVGFSSQLCMAYRSVTINNGTMSHTFQVQPTKTPTLQATLFECRRVESHGSWSTSGVSLEGEVSYAWLAFTTTRRFLCLNKAGLKGHYFWGWGSGIDSHDHKSCPVLLFQIGSLPPVSLREW